jgi:tRNA threonylcarbamoyladenosine biosynthesis protein TsaB
MIVLAADTSTDWLSVAVTDDGTLIEEFHEHRPRRHSELLMETTRDLLQRNRIQPGDIDLLAVSHGPGSFTGTRIGVSTWKGLAVGLSTPLVGVSTLEALAVSAGVGAGIVCPWLDAKMDEVFAAVFTAADECLQRTTDDRVCPPEAALEGMADGAVFLGEGALRYRDAIVNRFSNATLLGETFAAPHAASVATLALEKWRATGDGDPGSVRPVYLRKSQAEVARDAKSTEVGSL